MPDNIACLEQSTNQKRTHLVIKGSENEVPNTRFAPGLGASRTVKLVSNAFGVHRESTVEFIVMVKLLKRVSKHIYDRFASCTMDTEIESIKSTFSLLANSHRR